MNNFEIKRDTKIFTQRHFNVHPIPLKLNRLAKPIMASSAQNSTAMVIIL